MKKSLIITPILIALIAIDVEAQISEAPLINKGIPVERPIGDTDPILERRNNPRPSNAVQPWLKPVRKPLYIGTIRQNKIGRK